MRDFQAKDQGLTNHKLNSVFPLRLPASTRTQASEFASSEGISLNQFITLAVAEKIERMISTEADLQKGDNVTRGNKIAS